MYFWWGKVKRHAASTWWNNEFGSSVAVGNASRWVNSQTDSTIKLTLSVLISIRSKSIEMKLTHWYPKSIHLHRRWQKSWCWRKSLCSPRTWQNHEEHLTLASTLGGAGTAFYSQFGDAIMQLTTAGVRSPPRLNRPAALTVPHEIEHATRRHIQCVSKSVAHDMKISIFY